MTPLTHMQLTCHVVVIILLFGTIALGQQQQQPQQQPRCRGCRLRAATKQDQIKYLTKFGYMSSERGSILAAITNQDAKFRQAVILFQKMAGLNLTGKVDAATMAMMEMPRCGIPDPVGRAQVKNRRRRRYARKYDTIWPKTNLTYQFINLTPDLQPDAVKLEIKKAFKMWNDVTPLTFTEETSSSTAADIDIRFVTYEHGDSKAFDGKGGVLAHAIGPPFRASSVSAIDGDAHFDDDETWTSNNEGKNLMAVAVHEFGHSLGLSHSDVKTAVMYQYFNSEKPNMKLDIDDIRGIQSIYGKKPTSTKTSWSKFRGFFPPHSLRPSRRDQGH